MQFDDLEFLKAFPRRPEGLIPAWEVYTFDNLFRLLLKSGLDYEDALLFMFCECSFSAVVFQERIHNAAYLGLRAEDALPPEWAARKAQLMHDLLLDR